MPSFLQLHPARNISFDILFHLLFFAIITSIIVFLLRGPLRKYKSADMRFFEMLQPLHTARNNSIMKALTFLAKHQFLVPAILLLAAFFYFTGKRSDAFNLFVVSLSGLLLMFGLKQLFHRKRPKQPLLFEAKGLSFPSGHAIMSVCFYGMMLHLSWQTDLPEAFKITTLVIGIILILLIAFSRIYLQVHYLSDVLAGLIIGSCWLYVALHVFGSVGI